MKQAESLLDILFENRNKAYGAYDLRVNYKNRLLRAFLAAIFISVVLFLLMPWVLTSLLTRKVAADKLLAGTVIDLTKEYIIERPPEEEQIPVTKTKAVSDNATYQVVKNDAPENKEETKQVNAPSATGPETGEYGAGAAGESASGTTGPPPIDLETEVLGTAVLDVVPTFPGGEDALNKYLVSHIRYTGPAREERVSGHVYACFVVNESGGIDSIKIVRGLGYGLDEEVVRVVGTMPEWSPGIYRGKKVKTLFYLPVAFRIQ